MKKSRFFAELSNTYACEIDDLLSDSGGKTVLQARLKEKRDAIDAILPMISFAPEMVAVAFYEAFSFIDPALMQRTVSGDPEHPSFPQWAELDASLRIAAWAKPLIEKTLREEDGEIFLVTTAGLEFIRLNDNGSAPTAFDKTEKEDTDGEDDDEDSDLSEAGADWMASQGFDTPER